MSDHILPDSEAGHQIQLHYVWGFGVRRSFGDNFGGLSGNDLLHATPSRLHWRILHLPDFNHGSGEHSRGVPIPLPKPILSFHHHRHHLQLLERLSGGLLDTSLFLGAVHEPSQTLRRH